jgi:hypothetical protein
MVVSINFGQNKTILKKRKLSEIKDKKSDNILKTFYNLT